MALKSTIFKAELDIADLERTYYQTHSLRLARHSSETDERMMVRLLAFVCHAHERLTFNEGLANVDEPDLWQKDLTGQIELWIEVGQPDERRLLKACGRAAQVVVYSYASSSDIWWSQVATKLKRAKNLTVFQIPNASTLAKLAERNMQLHCMIQEGSLWWTAGTETLQVEPKKLRG
ncbi:YaeQ family protein [bacterium]|nr:YaeQ family protein [bacterium]